MKEGLICKFIRLQAARREGTEHPPTKLVLVLVHVLVLVLVCLYLYSVLVPHLDNSLSPTSFLIYTSQAGGCFQKVLDFRNTVFVCVRSIFGVRLKAS